MVEKSIELTGTSANSIEDAVGLAVSRAGVTIDGIRRADVIDISANVDDGCVVSWRVKVKVTFAVQDRLHE
jgi:flavin-binding protein dodecin